MATKVKGNLDYVVFKYDVKMVWSESQGFHECPDEKPLYVVYKRNGMKKVAQSRDINSEKIQKYF